MDICIDFILSEAEISETNQWVNRVDDSLHPGFFCGEAPEGTLLFSIRNRNFGDYYSCDGRLPLVEFAAFLNLILEEIKIGENRRLTHLGNQGFLEITRINEADLQIKYFKGSEIVDMEELKTALQHFCVKLREELSTVCPGYLETLVALDKDKKYSNW